MRRFDNFWLGLVAGIIVPMLFGWFFISSTYKGEIAMENLLHIVSGTSMMIKLIFIAILPNMFMVFLLNTWEYWKTCKGIFVAIFLYIALSIPFIA
jgi:hypothetical protein